jgi:mono/diheme cytochrome c family protein
MASVVAVAVLSLAWPLAGPAAAAGESPKAVVPAPTSELEPGRLAYEKFCAECHGVNTVGTDKGPTFLHRVYHPGHHADGAFRLATIRGARAHHWRFGDMKPVKGVSDGEIEAIIRYVRAVQKANGIH